MLYHVVELVYVSLGSLASISSGFRLVGAAAASSSDRSAEVMLPPFGGRSSLRRLQPPDHPSQPFPLARELGRRPARGPRKELLVCLRQHLSPIASWRHFQERLTAVTSAVDPSSLRIQSVADRRPAELARKGRYHVCGIDSVPGLGLDAADGGPVGNLRKLDADIDRDSLDDGARNVVRANAGPDYDAYEGQEEAEDGGHQGLHLINDQPGVYGRAADDHGTDEAEKANHDGGVTVRRRGQQERQGGPVRCEDGTHEEGTSEMPGRGAAP